MTVITRNVSPTLVEVTGMVVSRYKTDQAAMAAQIEFLRALAPTQWYQPAEKLPEPGDEVIAVYPASGTTPRRSAAVYFAGDRWICFGGQDLGEPELWCHLPTLDQPNLSPDWNKAPVETVAWAVDFDGKAHWFFDVPTQGFACWQTNHKTVPAGNVDKTNVHFNWRRTLSVRRPA